MLRAFERTVWERLVARIGAEMGTKFMKIGNVEFKDKAEYDAGMRDYKRIQMLKLRTDVDNPKAAERMYLRLKQQPYYFESKLGKEFMKELATTAGIGTGRAMTRTWRENRINESAHAQEIIEEKQRGTEERMIQPEERQRRVEESRPQLEKRQRRVEESRPQLEERQLQPEAKPQSKSNKERSAGRKIALLVTGIAAACVLIYSVGNAAIYQYRSYKSAQKMSEIQQSVLQPVLTLSEENAAILNQIAQADSNENSENVTAASGDYVKLSPYIDKVPGSNSGETNSILGEYSILYARNNDMAGWIEIDGTVINYPVMQTIFDEQYYLLRDFDKLNDINGLPFIDSRCSITEPTINTIIYAHNMKNGSMFASLLKYKDEAFYKEHKTVTFNTIYEKAEYEIVAAFHTEIADVGADTFRYYNFISAENESEYNDFIENVKALATYETGIYPMYGDQLLTLSTCDRTTEDGRFVVVARRIK